MWRVAIEAGVDDVDACRLEQRHEIGQRSFVAGAELVAPEARQAYRVGVRGVGQSGKRRGTVEVGKVGFAVGAGQRLDVERVAHDLGEQRRLEAARPRAAARHVRRRGSRRRSEVAREALVERNGASQGVIGRPSRPRQSGGHRRQAFGHGGARGRPGGARGAAARTFGATARTIGTCRAGVASSHAGLIPGFPRRLR